MKERSEQHQRVQDAAQEAQREREEHEVQMNMNRSIEDNMGRRRRGEEGRGEDLVNQHDAVLRIDDHQYDFDEQRRRPVAPPPFDALRAIAEIRAELYLEVRTQVPLKFVYCCIVSLREKLTNTSLHIYIYLTLRLDRHRDLPRKRSGWRRSRSIP